MIRSHLCLGHLGWAWDYSPCRVRKKSIDGEGWTTPYLCTRTKFHRPFRIPRCHEKTNWNEMTSPGVKVIQTCDRFRSKQRITETPRFSTPISGLLGVWQPFIGGSLAMDLAALVTRGATRGAVCLLRTPVACSSGWESCAGVACGTSWLQWICERGTSDWKAFTWRENSFGIVGSGNNFQKVVKQLNGIVFSFWWPCLQNVQMGATLQQCNLLWPDSWAGWGTVEIQRSSGSKNKSTFNGALSCHGLRHI